MVAETIFGDARVRKVSFTGSTELEREPLHLGWPRAGRSERI